MMNLYVLGQLTILLTLCIISGVLLRFVYVLEREEDENKLMSKSQYTKLTVKYILICACIVLMAIFTIEVLF